MQRFDPEAIDLAALVRHLHALVGPAVEGAVVGRTRLRDEVARHLGCSMLDAENIIDTMIGRGFLVRSDGDEAPPHWTLRLPERVGPD